MYSNIGGKIKVLAQIVGVVLLIAGIITCIVLLTNGYEKSSTYGSDYFVYDTSDDVIAFAALVAGVLGFASSWFLYGFGQLVEDTETIRGHLQELLHEPQRKDATSTKIPSLTQIKANAQPKFPQKIVKKTTFTRCGDKQIQCNNCGRVLLDDNKLCLRCGATFIKDEE